MLRKEILYTLDDVAIQPATVSIIDHRKECDPYINGFLPIFTSPMPNVVNKETVKRYIDAKINPILPRNTGTIFERLIIASQYNVFAAYSLDEAETVANGITMPNDQVKILIDIANGNMKRLMNVIEKIKRAYSSVILMVGNVANPETYRMLSDCGADMVRLSVGTGSACNTATYTGIYYPMASLIDKCSSMDLDAKIIADGGISNYRNAIKALALGADYVMMGGALNKLKDSAGVVQEIRDSDGTFRQYKLYYGMASERGQKDLNKDSISTPEGKVVMNPISNLTIADFAHEFENYLKSSMSYCGATNVRDFCRYSILNVISDSAQKQFNKD